MSSSLTHALASALLALTANALWAGVSLDQWLNATSVQTFAVPATHGRVATERLFAQLLEATDFNALARDATALGLNLERIEQQGQRWLGLSESRGQGRGHGAYVARIETRTAGDPARGEDAVLRPAPVLLQAPHRYKDRRTGALVLALLETRPFAAAAWNTVPRDARAADGGGADLARRSDTDFVAFSRAFARRHPSGRVVQIHGFAPAKRLTASGQRAELILSNGTHRPDAALQVLFACLREVFGDGALLYPWDVKELGGTKNAVGRALRAEGFGGFVHLELSAGLRARQLGDAEARRAAADCLLGAPR